MGLFALSLLLASQLAWAGNPATSLPDVESVLTKATDKAHDFAEQASAMQAKVALQQQKSLDALSAQKKLYESKLSQQAAMSDAISANNSAIDAANKALKKSNTDLEVELKRLQDENGEMRKSLQTIDEKVAAAKLFLEDSLKVTDDTDAEELYVLAPTTPKPTLDHFLAVAGGERVSLLQLSSPRSQGPEDLVSVLSQSLSEIATAEVEGAAELKAHFMANFQDGQRHQEALNATNAQLVQLQAELKAHQAKLLEAKSHLQATGAQLSQRLHGLRIFARKVDSAAATPLDSKPASQHPSTPAPVALAAHAAPATTLAPVLVAKPEPPAPKKTVAVSTQVSNKTVSPVAAAPPAPKAVAPAPVPAPKSPEVANKTAPRPAAASAASLAAKPARALRKASDVRALASAPKDEKKAAKEEKKVARAARAAARQTSKALAAASAAQKSTEKHAKTHSLIQSPLAQKKKVEVQKKAEAPSQWSKWLSALR